MYADKTNIHWCLNNYLIYGNYIGWELLEYGDDIWWKGWTETHKSIYFLYSNDTFWYDLLNSRSANILSCVIKFDKMNALESAYYRGGFKKVRVLICSIMHQSMYHIAHWWPRSRHNSSMHQHQPICLFAQQFFCVVCHTFVWTHRMRATMLLNMMESFVLLARSGLCFWDWDLLFVIRSLGTHGCHFAFIFLGLNLFDCSKYVIGIIIKLILTLSRIT